MDKSGLKFCWTVCTLFRAARPRFNFDEAETVPTFQAKSYEIQQNGIIKTAGWNRVMCEMRSTETKARPPELLRMVERAETIAITRHGKRVAHSVPARAEARAGRERAVARFRQLRAGWNPVSFSTEEILASRHEGHRL